MKIPKIAIIGQPNVGKSTIFNALLKRRAAIVDSIPGTTLDLNSAFLKHKGYLVEVIDSGGIGPSEAIAKFAKEVKKQIQSVIEQADGFIFVTDIRNGLTALDKEIGEMLRSTGKKSILLANKADTMILERNKNEFFILGMGEPLPVSALQKRGIDTLRDEIITLIKELGFEEETDPEKNAPLKIAIVGKRNVGKSTLVNTFAKEEKVIVSEIPGTTRDAIDVRFQMEDEIFIVIDTAGLRRKKNPHDTIEIYSRMRTESAVKRADVVLFLIDALEKVSEVDKKIAEYLVEEGKPCIIVVNKWDLVKTKTTTGAYLKYLSKELPNLNFAPMAFISAKEGFNVWDTIKLAKELYKQSAVKLTTSVINKALDKIRNKWSPQVGRGGAFPKVYYGTQTASNPPTIAIFVNNPDLFNPSYLKFMENKLRDELSFKEIPLRINLRQRHLRKKDDK